MKPLNSHFAVGKHKYHLFSHMDGEIVLSLTNAPRYKKHKYDLWYHQDNTGDVGFVGAKSITVFKTVKRLVADWVFNTKPEQFCFEAATSGKESLYFRFATQLRNSLADRYYFYDVDGKYTFYRQAS